MDSALRRVRRLFGISISEIVRAGTMQALVSKVPDAVRIIDDPKTGDAKRLKMIEFLQLCRNAHLAYHDPDIADILRQPNVL